MRVITPFLWFDGKAEQAADFYVSVFPNSRIIETVKRPEGVPGEAGDTLTVRFSLDGKEFVALNGGPNPSQFDDSVSFVVDCADQDEVDYYWSALCDGGEEIACGWLKDRYGLRWQVVPVGLTALLADPDRDRARRAATAMLAMKKLNLRAMADAAAAGGESGATA